MESVEKDFVEIFENPMTTAARALLASKYFLTLKELSEGEESYQTIHTLLSQCHFKYVLPQLNNCISAWLQESDETLFLEAGLWLIRTGVLDDTRLGITVLGHFEVQAGQLVLDYCHRPEFSWYALNALQFFSKPNHVLWEILPQLTGLCKTEALYFFQPVTLAQQQWMFEYGQYDEVLPDLTAAFCLMNVEMLKYFTDIGVTTENLKHYSHLFARSFFYQNPKNFAISAPLVKPYLTYVQRVSQLSILDIAAVGSLYLHMDPSDRGPDRHHYELKNLNTNFEKSNGWSTDLEKQVLLLTRAVFSRPEIRDTIAQALLNANEDADLLILTAYAFDQAQSIAFYFPFRFYTNLLEKRPFHPLLLSIFESRPLSAMDYHDLKQYLLDHAAAWQTADDPNENANPAKWLCFLLKSAQKQRDYDEGLFLSCLLMDSVPVRDEATRTLGKFKNLWDKSVVAALESHLWVENDTKIKRRLDRLLHGKAKSQKEETIDISKQKITAVQLLGNHLYVLRTYIAGTGFRKIENAASAIHPDSILYLQRESGNLYDTNAILVATQSGYVVGYIPKKENAELANQMDHGSTFYAVVGDVDWGNKKIEIYVCPSAEF